MYFAGNLNLKHRFCVTKLCEMPITLYIVYLDESETNFTNEPCREKTRFRICKNKGRSVTAQLISAVVIATYKVQSLDFLNPKFHASSHILWQYSLVCVRLGRKPRRQVFLHCSSNESAYLESWHTSHWHVTYVDASLERAVGRASSLIFRSLQVGFPGLGTFFHQMSVTYERISTEYWLTA